MSSSSFYQPAGNTHLDPTYSSNIQIKSLSIAFGIDHEQGDTPLLQELGISFDTIINRTVAIIFPIQNASVVEDNDVFGPLVFCIILGTLLFLVHRFDAYGQTKAGKRHFGNIYGVVLMGSLSIHCIINLMSRNGIAMTRVWSALGYSLVPILFLALFNLIFPVRGLVCFCVTLTAVTWSAATASRFFVRTIDLKDQLFLVAYPVFLFYSCFALLTIY